MLSSRFLCHLISLAAGVLSIPLMTSHTGKGVGGSFDSISHQLQFTSFISQLTEACSNWRGCITGTGFPH